MFEGIFSSSLKRPTTSTVKPKVSQPVSYLKDAPKKAVVSKKTVTVAPKAKVAQPVSYLKNAPITASSSFNDDLINAMAARRIDIPAMGGMVQYDMPTNRVGLSEVKQAAKTGYEAVKKGAGSAMGVIGGVIGTGAIAAAKTVSSGYKKVGLPEIPGISAWSGTDKDMQDLQKAYQQTSQFGYGIGEQIPSYGLEPTIKSTISTGKAIFTKKEDPIVNEIAQGWQEAKSVIGQQISPEQAKSDILKDNKAAIWGTALYIAKMLPVATVGAKGLQGGLNTSGIAKVSPTGKSMVLPVEDLYKAEFIMQMKRAGIKPENIIKVPDGIEIVGLQEGQLHLTPENIRVEPGRFLSGTAKVSEMKPTLYGRASEPITKIFRKSEPVKAEFTPSTQIPTSERGVTNIPTEVKPTRPATPLIPERVAQKVATEVAIKNVNKDINKLGKELNIVNNNRHLLLQEARGNQSPDVMAKLQQNDALRESIIGKLEEAHGIAFDYQTRDIAPAQPTVPQVASEVATQTAQPTITPKAVQPTVGASSAPTAQTALLEDMRHFTEASKTVPSVTPKAKKATKNILYHGSDAADIIRKEGFKFGEVSNRSVGPSTNVDRLGKGIYFSDNPKDAARYAKSWDEKDVVKTYVSPDIKIKNFKTYDEWYNFVKDIDIKAFKNPEILNKIFTDKGFGGVKVAGDTVIFDPKSVSTKPFIEAKVEAVLTDYATLEEIANIEKAYDANLPKYNQIKTYIDNVADSVARKFNLGENAVIKAPLKTKKSTVRKAITEKGKDITKVADVARNTIIVDNFDQIGSVIEELRKQGVFSADFIKEPDAYGYTGGISKHDTAYGPGEIQANIVEIIYGKEPEESLRNIIGQAKIDEIRKATGLEPGLGHYYYEEGRIFDAKSTLTKAEFDKLTLIKKKSNKYYSALRRFAATRSASAAEISLPSKSASVKPPVLGTKMPSSPSRSISAPPSGRLVTLKTAPLATASTKVTGLDKNGSISPIIPHPQEKSSIVEEPIVRGVGRPRAELYVGTKEEMLKTRAEKVAAGRKEKNITEAKLAQKAEEQKQSLESSRSAIVERFHKELLERAKTQEILSWRGRSEADLKKSGYNESEIKKIQENQKEYAPPEKKKEDLIKTLEEAKTAGKDREYFENLYYDQYEKDLDNINEPFDLNESESDIIKEWTGENFKQTFASRDSVKLEDFERRLKAQTDISKDFKLFEELYKLIHKYVSKTSTKGVSRGLKGVYNVDLDSIRLNSMNDVSTVTHEIAHKIDNSLDLSNRFSEDVALQLQDIYKKYYTKASSRAPASLKTIEGFATLVQKYVESPTKMLREYPELVREILTPGGKYFNQVIGEFLTDIDNIVSTFHGLTAEAKIAAVTFKDKSFLSKDPRFFNITDMMADQMLWDLHYLDKIDWKNGDKFTGDSISGLAFNYKKLKYVFNSFVKQKNGKGFFLVMDENGDWNPKYKFNLGTLSRTLKDGGAEKTYDSYIKARGIYFEKEELNNLLKIEDPTPEQLDRINQLEEIEKKNIISYDDASEVYFKYKDAFKEIDEEFDIMNREMINFSLKARRITPEKANEWLARTGYVTSKHFMADDFLDDLEYAITGNHGVGKNTVVSVFKSKMGSSNPYLDSITSTYIADCEIIKKGYKQMIYNQIYDNLDASPLYKQLFPEEPYNISHEQNPNYIIAIDKNFKKHSLKMPPEVQKTFEALFSPKEVPVAFRAMRKLTNFFQQMTTGFLYPAFSAVTNPPMDLITSMVFSRESVLPIGGVGWKILKSAATGNVKMLSKIKHFWKEYSVLNGEEDYLMSMNADAPEKYWKYVSPKTGVVNTSLMVKDGFIKVLKFIPNLSESIHRTSEYTLARLNGKTQRVALEEAANITGSWSKFGRWGNTTGQAIFKSAAYQNVGFAMANGMYRAFLQDPATRSKAWIITILVTGYILAQGELFYQKYKKALESGDQEEIDNLEKQKNDLLNNSINNRANYIYGFSNKSKYRFDPWLSTIGVFINMMLDDLRYDKKYSLKNYGELIDNLSPNAIQITDPISGLTTALPKTPTDEVYILGMKKKTYPYTKDIEPRGMEFKPSAERQYANTNELAKWLAQTPLAQKMGISALVIEEYMKAKIGRSGAMLTDMFVGAVKGKPGQLEKFTSTFSRPLTTKNDTITGLTVDKFYKDKDLVTAKYNKDKKNIANSKLYKQYNSYADLIGDIRSITYDKPESVPQSTYNLVYKLTLELENEEFDSAANTFKKLQAETRYLVSNYKILEQKKKRDASQ